LTTIWKSRLRTALAPRRRSTIAESRAHVEVQLGRAGAALDRLGRFQRSVRMAEIESRDDGVIVPMKRPEAAALAAVAETGLDADDALARIRNTATAERALNALRASRGSLSLRRPEAAALIAVAETGFALASAPRAVSRRWPTQNRGGRASDSPAAILSGGRARGFTAPLRLSPRPPRTAALLSP
jgi:hypothetical protein